MVIIEILHHVLIVLMNIIKLKKIAYTLDNDYKIYKTVDYHTDHISHEIDIYKIKD